MSVSFGRLIYCIAAGVAIMLAAAAAERSGVTVGVAWAQAGMKDRQVTVLDESFSGVAEVTVSGRLEIRLKARVSAGMIWSLDKSATSAVKFVGDRLEPTGALEGSPSIQVFVFEGVLPGDARLTFRYGRPKQPSDKTSTFAVRVTAK